MSNKNLLKIFILSLFAGLFSSPAMASFWLFKDDKSAFSKYPFYFGGTLGFGDTNWGGLVDPNAVNDGSDSSTPVKAKASGIVWGLMAGYELNNYFAIQGNYQHYPTSQLFFDEYNFYYPNESIVLESQTETYSMVGKFMVPIFNTGFRLFSDLGPAYTRRSDDLANINQWAAQFGGGINYNITPRFLAEINFTYTTGWGVSDTEPAYEYVPFLYSINFGLAYRFNI